MMKAKTPMLKRKSTQVLLVAIIVLLIALAGTFAWYSFNQRATNEFEIKVAPDVNLHDDFEGGPEKDVYVENSGQQNVYVRVKLSEYMEIGGVSLVTGAEKDDPNTWTAHVPGLPGAFECDSDLAEWFHDYYTWTMGGRKFYRPAEDSAKSSGKYGDDNYTEPQAVGDITDYADLLRDAFSKQLSGMDLTDALQLITNFLNYDRPFSSNEYAQLAAYIDGLKDTEFDVVIWQDATSSSIDPNEQQTMYLSDIKMTLTGDAIGTIGGEGDPFYNKLEPPMVITMDMWKNGVRASGDEEGAYILEPYAKGEFWVVDKDGWAYWATALPAGEATGLLLSYVDRTDKVPNNDAYYAIDVWLQAVTADDIDKFGSQGGGISNEGLLMMKLNSGDFIYEGNDFYYDYGNNVFSLLDNELKPVGDKFLGSPDGKAIGATIASGTSIKVYDATTKVVPSDEIFDAANIVTGRNGKSYIALGDGSYAVSVAYAEGEFYESGGADMPTAPYSVIGLGEGYDADTKPFIRVWPDASGLIGGGNDVYESPYVEIGGQTYHYLGDGVYVHTTLNTKTGAYEDDSDYPVTYYFTAGSITDVSGFSDVSEFELALTQGDNFSFVPTTEASELGLTAGFGEAGTPGGSNPIDDFTFEFAGLYKGANGQWYIATADVFTGTSFENPQGENTLITLNRDKEDGGILGDQNNVLVWAKKPGVDDQYERFNEPFLKGIKKEDLLPGGNGFSVDNATWKVLDIDQYGNRLLLCDSASGNKVTMGKSIYSQSNVKAEMQNVMKTLPTIAQYALPVNLPVWYRQFYSAGGAASKVETNLYGADRIFNNAELSSAKNINNWSTAGAEGFALSLTEAIKYSDKITYCEDSWWLRSAGKITGCGTKLPTQSDGYKYQKSEPLASQICGTHDGLSFVKDGTATRDIHTMGAYTDSFRCRVAMWVRFSDADKLAAEMVGG